MDPVDPCYVGFSKYITRDALTKALSKVYRGLFHLRRGTHERNARYHSFDSPGKEET